MNFKKYKGAFYIFTFLLVTVVATVLKEINNKSIPQVSDAILIVGAVYGIGYLIINLIKKGIKK